MVAARPDPVALRAQIVEAWQPAVYPGDEQICTPTYCDEGVAAYFRGRGWQGHEVASLRYHEVGLSFFTAAGFAYYLAAYLLAVLDDAAAADVIYDGIVFHLSPAQLGRTWADSYRARIARLTPAQRDAVVAYLGWCDDGRGDPELAATIDYLRTGTVAAPASPRDQLLQLAGATPDARSLRLGHTTVSDAQLAGLAELPALVELDLGGTAITDAGMAALAGAPGLKVLELRNCTQLTAAGLGHVGRLAQLEELYLSNADLDDAGAQALAPLALVRLDLTHARGLTDAGWAALDVARLERLDAFGIAVPAGVLGAARRLTKLVVKSLDDAGLGALAGAPVKELDVSDADRVTEIGLAALGTVASLTSLQLGKLAAARWPAGFPALEQLVLLSTELGAGLASGIAALPVLSELRLFGGGCAPGALAALAASTCLRSLTLWLPRAPDSLAELAGNTSLASLSLHTGAVTAAELDGLARLPALTTLQLSEVRDLDVTQLVRVAQLRELVLEDLPVDDAGLAALAGCPHLRSIRIARTQTPAASLAAFRQAHPGVALVAL
jgi:uncharacterized protein DUF6714/Leucine Rich Repeat (LRR) protein